MNRSLVLGSMSISRIPVFHFALCALLFSLVSVRAQPPGVEMAETANNFLAALSPEQKAKAVFEFKNDERMNWHFVPMARKGLPLAEMSPAQQRLAQVLLNSALSHRGYFKVLTIMSLEQVLFELENQSPRRNPELYYVSIFGTPGADAWGWRVEGHHISLNFTVQGDKVIATTPSFLGSNPAEVKEGPRKGLRVLGREEDFGRALVKSLTDTQRKTALVASNAPSDIITSDARKAWVITPPGLAASQMNKSQRDLLISLIREYTGRNRAELAEADWQKIEKAGWTKIHFAWAGGLEPGQGHYYRVQGPAFLFEYDNTQNNTNHIHAVWRDVENDFGEDVLRKHYEGSPHKH